MTRTPSRFLTSLSLSAVLFVGAGCANEERDCQAGDTRPADDGCNTCTCDVNGGWSCTEIACADAGCTEGETRLDDDGCNTCSCGPDGVWACTLMACIPDPEDCTEGETRPAADGCNTCSCFEGGWACTEMACGTDDACSTDADCFVSGCSGQICAGTEVDTDCAWIDEYACYADPAITSCGCQAGSCGWAQTPELDACLNTVEPALCTPGDISSPDDCNTCTCSDDGLWLCTLMACETPCVEGEVLPAPDGCNTCTCMADGSLACTEMACVPDPSAECMMDTDCVVTGCSGQICAATDVESTCEFLPEYACYTDETITSCGCIAGACAWVPSPELDRCLGDAE
jgi:eight-cysteine-cluster-containing protein